MLGYPKFRTLRSIVWPQNLIPTLKQKRSLFFSSYISFLEFPTGLSKSGRWVPYTFKSVVNLSSIAHHGTMITSFFLKNSTSNLSNHSWVSILPAFIMEILRCPQPTPPNTTPSTHLEGVDDATCHLEAVSLIVINGDFMGPTPINGRKSMGSWCSEAL